ncbi:MAG: cytochrome c3 family protein [Gemmatimonadota bacterium]
MRGAVTTGRLVALAVVALLGLGGTGLWAAAQQERQPFPHAQHAALFPTCSGCHGELPTGQESMGFPDQELCAACHDGAVQPTVTWSGFQDDPDNLRFTHGTHRDAARAGGDSLTCHTCHAADGSTAFMAVAAAEPAWCLDCHAHEAPEHLAADADCRQCHMPLAEADELAAWNIAAFPEPSSHAAEDYAFDHAPSEAFARQQCAVCHAVESCSRCHLNAADVPAIAALGSDPRLLVAFSERVAVYPLPDSHEEQGWLYAHGQDANARIQTCANCHAAESCSRCHLNAADIPAIAALASDPRALAASLERVAVYPLPESHEEQGWLYSHRQDATARIQTCANCHARPSCNACHIGEGGRELIRMLPAGPGGVQISGWRVTATPGAPDAAPRAATVRHPELARPMAPQQGESQRAALLHPPGFATAHGGAAAADQPSCSSCHTSTFCSDCHDAPESSGFHAPNFVQRHATDAYSRQTECSTCHNTQSFCKSCHESVGLGSEGRLDVAFHNALPLWLLQHAQAARQGLESCATCHAERDCQQCHSATGGWRISPHGPDFDPTRMADRNKLTCRRCHIAIPGGG